jgi:hypothetical protein
MQNRKGLTLETVFLTKLCSLARDLKGIFPRFCGLSSLFLFPLGDVKPVGGLLHDEAMQAPHNCSYTVKVCSPV